MDFRCGRLLGLVCENSRHISGYYNWFPREMTPRRNSLLMTRQNPYLGSASDSDSDSDWP